MNGSQLTFGIEIECAIPTTEASANFPRGGYHRGLQITQAPQGWNCQADGSVRSRRSGYTPVEVVSPILSGLDGLSQAAYMAEYLNDVEAEFNQTGGMHIHVGVPTNLITASFMERFTRLYRRYERAFYALNGGKVNTRFSNHFCSPWNGNATHAVRGNRYMGLNLNNLGNGDRSTVEFRMFAGTGELEQIITAAYMCVALVSAALDETIDIEDRFNFYTTPKSAVNKFIRQVLAHTSTHIVPDSPIEEAIDHLSAQLRAAVEVWRL